MTGRGRNDKTVMATNRTRFTRRGLFELAGLTPTSTSLPSSRTLVGAAAIAALPEGSPETPGAVMEALSTYMSEAAERALPDEVVEKTKRHVLDTVAAMISGSQLLPGHFALAFAKEYGGKEVATVVSSKLLCGPIEAAMTNAVLAHSDETDDSHPGSQSQQWESSLVLVAPIFCAPWRSATTSDAGSR
jgi:hypothetical protein